MKLRAKVFLEQRFLFEAVAVVMPALALGGATSLVPLLFAPLAFVEPAGPLAQQVGADTHTVVAEYSFGVKREVALAEIAGVELHPSTILLFDRALLVRIFLRDGRGAIEIEARQADAEAFVRELARRARSLGVRRLGVLRRPRILYALELLPLLVGVVIAFSLPQETSWLGLALGLVLVVGWKALGWRRSAEIAKRAMRVNGVDDAPKELQTWLAGIAGEGGSENG